MDPVYIMPIAVVLFGAALTLSSIANSVARRKVLGIGQSERVIIAVLAFVAATLANQMGWIPDSWQPRTEYSSRYVR